MGYKIIEASNSSELTTLVNESMKYGWIPTGGLTSGITSEGIILYQAMVLQN